MNGFEGCSRRFMITKRANLRITRKLISLCLSGPENHYLRVTMGEVETVCAKQKSQHRKTRDQVPLDEADILIEGVGYMIGG